MCIHVTQNHAVKARNDSFSLEMQNDRGCLTVCGFNEDKAATKRHLQICNWLHIYLLPEV